MFCVAALALSMGVFASGCTVKAKVGGNPTIVYYGGYYGYYTNNIFCDWANNYCGTGLAYGIYDNGLGYTGSYGSTGGSTGTYGSTGGSTGTYGSTGGSTGTYGSTGGSTGTYGSTGGSTGTYGSTGSSGYSITGSTRDTDLQQADLQKDDVAMRAQSVATQFQMNYDAAVQLTQLADKVQAMTANGSMSSEDREAITESALSVAGISSDDMNSAIATMIKDGNSDAVNALMDKAATNLGMPSSAALRNQILPALGINVGAN